MFNVGTGMFSKNGFPSGTPFLEVDTSGCTRVSFVPRLPLFGCFSRAPTGSRVYVRSKQEINSFISYFYSTTLTLKSRKNTKASLSQIDQSARVGCRRPPHLRGEKPKIQHLSTQESPKTRHIYVDTIKIFTRETDSDAVETSRRFFGNRTPCGQTTRLWAKVTAVVETGVGTRDATPHLRGPLNTVKPQAPRARSQWNRYSTVPFSSTRELSVAGAPQRQSGTGRRKLGRVSLRSRSVMLIRFVPVAVVARKRWQRQRGGRGVTCCVCIDELFHCARVRIGRSNRASKVPPCT